MTNHEAVNRLFSMEGATHIYSSDPTLLTPADLYQIKNNPAQLAALQSCNIYLIVRRQRIYLDSQGFACNGRAVTGNFLVRRETTLTPIPFTFEISEESVPREIPILQVTVAENGCAMLITTPLGQHEISVNVVVARAKSTLSDQETGLVVLYVGQSIGKKNPRTALDRLLSHTTLQRILAETSTHFYEREVLLLLYRFEHGRTLISNGGDFNVDFEACDQRDAAHLNRLRNIRLNRHDIVSLAEAALINYFKPDYNKLLKSTNFANGRLSVLKRLLGKGIAGLIVELSTVNLRSRIGTFHAPPTGLTDFMPIEVLEGRYLDDELIKQQWQEELVRMAHTHIARFALTTPQERETFLHGVVFSGHGDRFMGC